MKKNMLLIIFVLLNNQLINCMLTCVGNSGKLQKLKKTLSNTTNEILCAEKIPQEKQRKQKNNPKNDPNYILHQIVVSNNSDLLEKTLPHIKDIDKPNRCENSALYLACGLVLYKPVSLLLKHGANPNSRNEHQSTPLLSSLSIPFYRSPHELETIPDIVNLLLSYGADPFIKNEYGYNSITYIQAILNTIDEQKQRTDFNEFGAHMVVYNGILKMLLKEESRS